MEQATGTGTERCGVDVESRVTTATALVILGAKTLSRQILETK